MKIKTPSRLHMTLIDLNGSYGRADGGIGLAIQNPNFILETESSEKGISIESNLKNGEKLALEHSQKIENAANRVIKHFNIESGYHFNVLETLPPHSGLGSGTQVSLATAKSICQIEGIDVSIPELSLIVGRGITSGIGTFAFDKGGFIVDGGYNLAYKGAVVPSEGDPTLKPKLIARYDFPEEWNVVVAIPDADHSITGMKEVDTFKSICPVPSGDVEKISHLILMNLIPFIMEKNIICVGKVVNKIQQLGFKREEIALQHETVRDLMKVLKDAGGHGVGMSSFGPAIYTFTKENPKEIIDVAENFIGEKGTVISTKAQNKGYEIKK